MRAWLTRMIRRDYILKMIEESVRALMKIKALKTGEQWTQARGSLDDEFVRLIGVNAEQASALSETELLARVIERDSSQAVRERTLILAALLRESGDVAALAKKEDESYASYLKGLHLLLETLSSGDGAMDVPEFVPSVDSFLAALGGVELPPRTQAMLMQHYERIGEFAKAEDALFAILDLDPQNRTTIQFGLEFYRRLQAMHDAALVAGNLPRAEVEEGIADLRLRAGSHKAT